MAKIVLVELVGICMKLSKKSKNIARHSSFLVNPSVGWARQKMSKSHNQRSSKTIVFYTKLAQALCIPNSELGVTKHVVDYSSQKPINSTIKTTMCGLSSC